jgi:glutathione S-transferase
MARKDAGIKYPKAYADSADMSAASAEQKKAMHIFNCAQRAHGNFLENHPSVAISMLISGLRYPIATAALGATWIVGRIVSSMERTNQRREGNADLFSHRCTKLATLPRRLRTVRADSQATF